MIDYTHPARTPATRIDYTRPDRARTAPPAPTAPPARPVVLRAGESVVIGRVQPRR